MLAVEAAQQLGALGDQAQRLKKRVQLLGGSVSDEFAEMENSAQLMAEAGAKQNDQA